MNNFTYMKDRDFSHGRKYIGASDIPTIAGVNEYQTPYDFFAIWTGRKEGFKGNRRTAAGHRQEPIILGEYIRNKVIDEFDGEDSESAYKTARIASNDFIVSRLWGDQQFKNYHSWTECSPAENPRFVAHADLLDLSGDIPVLVQAKNTGQYAADTRRRNPYKGYSRDDLSQNGIPIGVWFQEQWECYCYGIPSAWVMVQIDGWEIRQYGKVEYDKGTVEKLYILADRMLWHIDRDIPPTPQTWPDVLEIFPNLEKNTKTVLSQEDELEARKILSELNKITASMATLEKKKLDRQMALAIMAGEPNTGVMRNFLTTSDGSSLATFGERSGQERISLPGLKEKFPEHIPLYEASGIITQDNPTRMIYISGAPAGSCDLFACITYGEDGKAKKSRKKYDKEEKKALSAFAKSAGLKIDWERWSK